MKKYYILFPILAFGFTKTFSKPDFFKNDIQKENFTSLLENHFNNQYNEIENSINSLNNSLEELENQKKENTKDKNLKRSIDFIKLKLEAKTKDKKMLDGKKELLKKIKNSIDFLYTAIDLVPNLSNSSNTIIIEGIFQQFLKINSQNTTLENKQNIKNFFIAIKEIDNIKKKIIILKESNAVKSILNHYFNINSLFSFVEDCETFMIKNKILEKDQLLKNFDINNILDLNSLKLKLNFNEKEKKSHKKIEEELDLDYDIIESNEASKTQMPKNDSWKKWIISGLSKIKPW